MLGSCLLFLFGLIDAVVLILLLGLLFGYFVVCFSVVVCVTQFTSNFIAYLSLVCCLLLCSCFVFA